MFPELDLYRGSHTGQEPQSKGHTAACLVLPSRAGPTETHLFIVKAEIHHIMFFFALLLLFYCAVTHGPPGSVLLVASR